MTARRPGEKPVLIVIGSGSARHYREYSLRALAGAYDVVLIDDADPTWQRLYIVDAEVADLTDDAQVRNAASRLAARHAPSGVMSWDERRIVSAAEVAVGLELPHTPPDDVRACRDKFVSRARLAEHRVPSAGSFLVHDEHEARMMADELGWPVVVKPRALAGSIGVVKVSSADRLSAAWRHVRNAEMPGMTSTGDILIEEYLDGPEVSVECVCHGGTTTVVAVARKRLGPEPYFEETGHTVDSADPLALPRSAVADVARRALNALGVTTGVSHVEIRLTADGPRVVEVNARLGGDLIPALVGLATGVDLSRAAADTAIGTTPNLTPTRRGAAAVRFFYPVTKGTFVGFAEDSGTLSAPWLHTFCQIQEPGADVAPPPDTYLCRLGFAVVTGPDAAACQWRLDTVETRLAPQVTSAGARP